MNRFWTLCIGPEVALGVLTIGVFWFCASYNSGTGRDVVLIERLLLVLPLVAAPLAFLTFLTLETKSWWSVGRINLALFVGLIVCGTRLVAALGSGAKGQDVAFLMALAFGVLLGALGNGVIGAAVLFATRPGLAAWFRAHRFLGSVLTLLSTIPIGMVMAIGVTILVALVGGMEAFSARLKR